MPFQHCAISFVFGPSGVGKSSFGRYLSDHHNWLHLEIDAPNTNHLDAHGIRHEWGEYRNGNAAPLLGELDKRVRDSGRAGCVLTFRSTDLLLGDELQLTEKQGVGVRYLYGPAADCIDSFLQREAEQGSQLSLNHWLIHNQDSYLRISLPDLAPYRIAVFNADGTRRHWGEVAQRFFVSPDHLPLRG
jgi:hypothetical protein